MKDILLTIAIAVTISFIFITVLFMSINNDARRNTRFDECQLIAEQNQLGQEFIKNCMN